MGRGDPSARSGAGTGPGPLPLADPRYGADGLIPAVVQDAGDGRVLMLAYMDAEALGATLTTGDVHFHSRSRGRLWRKGETSGNVLRVVSLALDCDRDAILIQAVPTGPTCHRGTRSCFDPLDDPAVDGARASAEDRHAGPSTQGFVWLESLWSTIEQRRVDRPTGSYTSSLLEGGVDTVGRKVTEEATEVLLAGRDDAEAEREAARIPAAPPGMDPGSPRIQTRTALAGEAADLLYHLLVLLAERDLPPSAVIETLRSRHRG